MKTICNLLAVIMFMGAFAIHGKAQDSDRALLRQVARENQEAVDAIAMYPTETRKMIFVAAGYPEIIAKLSAMQKTSQDAFEKLISSFNQKDQEKFWNLTRYDGLVSDLAKNPYHSDLETYNLLVNYPMEIHATAIEEQKNNYNLLVQLDKMNNNYNADLESMLASYPPEADTAFREIIKIPEVLSTLFDHMQYTVIIGDYYKKNPERVIYKTDSLNTVLTQKNAQNANDWKQSMQDNPQVQQEFTQAAQEYAQDIGYQPDDYDTPLTPDVTNYSNNPYCWWFGYPTWYPDNSWNPYPYWYDWGFYFGPGKKVLFFGLPSNYFMDWYFYNPEHCSRYAELSNHYYSYYNNHPESINYNSISHGVNDWRIKNKDIVTDNWAKDNASRIQRFKEYGQMEKDRQDFNKKNPQQQMKLAEFIQKSPSRYPLLSVDVADNQVVKNNSKNTPTKGSLSEPAIRPTVQIPNQYKAEQKPVTGSSQPNQKAGGQSPSIANKPAGTPHPSNNFNQIRNAQQYHQNTWNQIQSAPARQQAPQPVQQSGRRK